MHLKIAPKVKLPPKAIIIAHPLDVSLFLKRVKIKSKYNLPLSKLYSSERLSLVGPCLGGPQVMLIVEYLKAFGIKEILFFGWCSGLQPKIKIGDIVLADAATKGRGIFRSDRASISMIISTLEKGNLPYHIGTVYSTDNPYAETEAKLKKLKERGILAMDMESADLLKISKLKGIFASVLLLVSDRFVDGNWEVGFKDANFKASKKATIDALKLYYAH